MSIRIYWRDGFPHPSVTSVCSIIAKGEGLTRWIADVGYLKSKIILAEAGDRGRRVHKLLELKLLGEKTRKLKKYADVWPYFEAGLSVISEHGIVPVQIEGGVPVIEHALYSSSPHFAGTVDTLAYFDGDASLIDWKTSSAFHPEYALQTAAYYYLIRTTYPSLDLKKRIVIRLDKEGKSHIKFYEDYEGDLKAFLSALDVFNWYYRKDIADDERNS